MTLCFLVSSPAAHGDSRPDILLITIDTLRADHLGCYGYKSRTSPNIDALAKESLLFTSAFSTAPITLPAHASILTGMYPARHSYRDNAFYSPTSASLLATELKSAGYTTAAFVSGAPLSSSYGLTAGFDVYDDAFEGAERAADATTDRVLRWLEEPRQRAYFAWVHYFDPHAEYAPPPQFGNLPPYDGEIAFVDAQIGRLLKAIGDNTIVVLTADHGESLGEHGESTHGIFVYNATLHVPLLLRVPGKPGGIRKESVSVCDIAPALRELAKLPAQPSDGKSLLAPAADRILIAESLYAARNFGYSPLFAAIGNHHKYIEAPAPELYDLSSDPRETRSLPLNKEADGLVSAARKYAGAAVKAPERDLPEEEKEKLRSLGYVGGSRASGSINPRERIAAIEEFNEGMGLLRKERNAAAEEIFRKRAKAEPENGLAWRFLGDALAAQKKDVEAEAAYSSALRLMPEPETGVRLAKTQYRSGRHEAAEATLRQTTQRYPAYEPALFELVSLMNAKGDSRGALALLNSRDSAEAHNQRGILLLRMQDLAAAEREFETATQKQQRPEYFNNLGITQQRLNRVEDAATAFRKALQLRPAYEECEVNLSFLLIQQQKWEEALQHLARLTDANPKLWNARMARGFALESLGRTAEALQQYQALLREAPQDWPQRSQVSVRILKLEK